MLANRKKLWSRGGIASGVFVCSGFYLFISNTGLSSLISFKTLLFLVFGAVIAALIIGISAELFQRNLGNILWRSIENPISPEAVRKINAIGSLVLMAWQVVITFLFAKLAYVWFTLYFAT
jgi:hypothetical protein